LAETKEYAADAGRKIGDRRFEKRNIETRVLEKVKTVFDRYDEQRNPKKRTFAVTYESTSNSSDSETKSDIELSFEYQEPVTQARKKRKKDNHLWSKKKNKK
jgi:hypothetical protein